MPALLKVDAVVVNACPFCSVSTPLFPMEARPASAFVLLKLLKICAAAPIKVKLALLLVILAF